ncbi:MAG: inositol monophosphatase [Minisyncoccia bacterium]
MEYKEFVVDLAEKAGKIMLANFSLGMKKDWKEDNTPLTITDTTINKMVIEEVKKNFPDHALLGEEESNMKESEYVWVCDPVDGTVPFSHGYPTFMFSLALTHNGESILGVLYDPTLKRMFYAEKGKGAFLNGQPMHVSKVSSFKNAMVNLDTDVRLIDLRKKLIDKDAYTTTFYSATYGAALVVCGEFVAQVYEYDKPWDGAAVKIIVEEAGGKVTDIAGKEQRYDKPINGFVATNGSVHDEIIRIIQS